MMETKYGPYSPSRLDVALCPFRFKAEYIDKTVQDGGSMASRRGNVVHETFEKITRGWLEDKPLNWDDVVEILTKKMAEYAVTDRDDQQLCIGAAQAYMSNPPQGIKDILGTEEHLALKWEDGKLVECKWDDPKCFARGKIDILQIDAEDNATIIDHKTQMFIQTADTFQMGFYAWLIKQFYPYVKSVSTVLHFCSPSLNWYSRPYTWTDEDLNNLEIQIKISIGAIEGIDQYPARPNHSCQYCPVQSECPKLLEAKESRKKFRKGILVNAQEALQLAEDVTVIEEYRKGAMTALKEFTKEIGAVCLPGLEYAHRESSGYDVDPHCIVPLYKLLNEYGVNVADYVKFDTVKMKKHLWKVLDQQKIEEIAKLLTETKSTRFSSKRV